MQTQSRPWQRWTDKFKRRLFLSHLIPYLSNEFRRQDRRIEGLERRVRLMQEALGRIESRQLAQHRGHRLQDYEFRVFSQWGEDGIIEHLCREIAVPRAFFVEFGVENYEQANTRFLLMNRNWSGLVIDGSREQIDQVRGSREHWLYDLTAVESFVTRENINDLLRDNGASGPIGLLSIDIDGMDWWVWEAINAVEPAIVVIEYNHRFGPEASVVVPYDRAFDRRRAHPSLIYYGASLRALCRLGRRKGYAFVGCGSAGLNAFFVRDDLRPESVPEVSAEDGFVPGQFCEAHDEQGNRVKMDSVKQQELLQRLPLIVVAENGEAV